MNFDQDALIAGVELAGRAGAQDTTIGWLHDDVPFEEAGWFAHAQFRGARVTVQEHRGPVEAVEALARRLLAGATCRRCGKPISLSDGPDVCRWTRMGKRWESGCDLPIDPSIALPPWMRTGAS